jgi:two-component system NarL family sensor kinase
VATIAHAALINVRRHSRATRASVRVESDASGWMLIVEDNGTGMGFTGTRSHDELERRGAGPRVIRERVADMGGRLSVTSSPAGTRLEIAFQAVAQVR